MLHPPVICITLITLNPSLEQAPHLVRMADADGSTPLMLACEAGHEEAASLLVAAGGAGSQAGGSQGGAGAEHALVAAAAAGQVSVAEWLLVRGAAVRGAGPETPLHAAAAKGHAPLISLLLAHGAPPSPLNQRGQTALQLAQLHGQASCAQLLADAARPSGGLHAAAVAEVPRAAPRASGAWAGGGAAAGGGGASGAMQEAQGEI